MFNRRNYPDFRIDPTADLGVEGRDGVDFEERGLIPNPSVSSPLFPQRRNFVAS